MGWLTADDLVERVVADRLDCEVPEDTSRLLRASERDVLAVVGHASLAATAPDLLTPGQLVALADAQYASCAHRLLHDPEELLRAPNFIGGNVRSLGMPSQPPTPEVARALAGTGLIMRRLCAPRPIA